MGYRWDADENKAIWVDEPSDNVLERENYIPLTECKPSKRLADFLAKKPTQIKSQGNSTGYVQTFFGSAIKVVGFEPGQKIYLDNTYYGECLEYDEFIIGLDKEVHTIEIKPLGDAGSFAGDPIITLGETRPNTPAPIKKVSKRVYENPCAEISMNDIRPQNQPLKEIHDSMIKKVHDCMTSYCEDSGIIKQKECVCASIEIFRHGCKCGGK